MEIEIKTWLEDIIWAIVCNDLKKLQNEIIKLIEE